MRILVCSTVSACVSSHCHQRIFGISKFCANMPRGLETTHRCQLHSKTIVPILFPHISSNRPPNPTLQIRQGCPRNGRAFLSSSLTTSAIALPLKQCQSCWQEMCRNFSSPVKWPNRLILDFSFDWKHS